MGWSGWNFMTIVSGPMVSDRANTSKSATDACRCISISPESSYASRRSLTFFTWETPRQPPPSNGFMNSG